MDRRDESRADQPDTHGIHHPTSSGLAKSISPAYCDPGPMRADPSQNGALDPRATDFVIVVGVRLDVNDRRHERRRRQCRPTQSIDPTADSRREASRRFIDEKAAKAFEPTGRSPAAQGDSADLFLVGRDSRGGPPAGKMNVVDAGSGVAAAAIGRRARHEPFAASFFGNYRQPQTSKKCDVPVALTTTALWKHVAPVKPRRSAPWSCATRTDCTQPSCG